MKQFAILQRYPEATLNNTTTNHLGNTPEPIEVFPPEIFFKGKFPPNSQTSSPTKTMRSPSL